ncbi:type VI secretion system lipoprotein TssJ [Halopseudomonas maritima]|uniref:type VI secretion system lipoprotein TssJ n=1 Tax=Halopseudomonas maritima TaxID=2918528 RepID=UPI001EEBD02D|nr:type VI secretion system lipoprotein TssJ [Halopseudomonas maritima]UJJ31764.1 type VI secretion system lipoprotein TssJ [Halopseudomonas maritima]
MYRLLPVLAACLLSACSMLSPYSELTKIDLQLSASDSLNPDLHGRPSPVVLQLVELRHPVAFEQADFFALQQRPQQILSPDLLALQELELRPGEQRSFKIAARPDTRYLGLVAAYRDLPNSRWRIQLALQPGKRNTFELALGEYGIEPRHPAGDR